jgi:hypothetical protein
MPFKLPFNQTVHVCLTSEVVRKRAEMIKRYPVVARVANLTRLDFHRQVCFRLACRSDYSLNSKKKDLTQ